ncbi:PspC domain-containing protein [Euzebya tangerina]|uniref:PspC domain-containing protein n=1 Tax=Euzebya tangerina TaxID=591198 RepID=UPI00196BA89B|nr:PspC domain-containing protein [Euzebya tangerina]
MSTATAPTTSRRLYRSTRDSRLGGVCGGLAEMMGWDPTTVRLVAVLSLLLPGPQAIIYLAAWAIIPTDATVFGWNDRPSGYQPNGAPPHPPAPSMPTPPAQASPAPAAHADAVVDEAAQAQEEARAEVEAADVTNHVGADTDASHDAGADTAGTDTDGPTA